MSLEQDIQDLTRNIDDLNDAFTALNATVFKNLDAQGVSVTRQTKAIDDNTSSVKENTKANQEASLEEVRRAKRSAQTSLESERYMRSFAGRLEMAAGSSVAAHKSLLRMSGFVNGASQVLGTLGKTAMAFGKAMYQGEQGAAANNSAIEAASKGLKDFLGNFGLVGKIVGSLVGLFGDWLQETNKLSDRLYTAYSEMARVGVAASDGMRGAADAAVRLGFGLSDAGIQNFIKLMKGAAGDLALLSGSAIEGRKQFVAIAEQLIDRGPVQRGLMNLGLSVEDINQGVANFVQNQVGLGIASRRTNQELVRGSIDFIKQLDIMAKLTGQQAQDMQAQIDANRRNERFRATIEKVRLEEGEDAARNLELNMAALARVAPDTAKGLMDIAGNFVGTKEAAQAFQSGLSGIPDLMKRQLGGGFQELGVAVKQTTNAYGVSLGQVGAFGDVFGSLYEQYKLGNMSQQDFNKALDEAIRQQREQMSGADGLVGAQTNMRIAQMDTRDSLQQLGVVTATVTTPALADLAQAANSITRILTSIVPQTGGQAVGAVAGTAAGAKGGAMLGAKLGAFGGLPGVAIGTTLGGITGAVAGYFGGKALAPGAAPGAPVTRQPAPQSQAVPGAAPGAPNAPGTLQPSTTSLAGPPISFQSGSMTGTPAHFGQLDPEFRARIEAMAAEYRQLTGGKTLQINSAFRSAEEQAALIAKGGQGANPAAKPGQSRHQLGLAIDVPPNQRAQLEALGLLKKYRMAGIPNDPPHIQSLQYGGIATGPKSGYTALLHGNEAVVPLADGKTIPVEMPNLDRSMQDQASMLGAQLQALEELVRYMRDNNAISTRILQAANN